jgi:hypothetical protein
MYRQQGYKPKLKERFQEPSGFFVVFLQTFGVAL